MSPLLCLDGAGTVQSTAGRPGFDSREGKKKILVGTVSRPALVFTHADVQRFQGLLPRQ
jgi:hypothetical protein